MTPDEFYALVQGASNTEGRLPLSRMTGWEIFPFEPDGLRVVPLAPPELPEPARHGEGGKLMVGIGRAIEALPNVARAHVSRWGDGGAHLHLFFYARPAGFQQLRGTCLAIWDDLLPAVPDEFRSADASAVARALAASYGGVAAADDSAP
jgi:hypothetical protein